MTPRIDPIAEPRPVSPRPRRNALHPGNRQAIPTLPDPIDDESAEFCAIADVPPVARAVGVEAYRRGRASLSVPTAPGQLWHGYLGRLAARTWRPIACRRVDASHFVSVR